MLRFKVFHYQIYNTIIYQYFYPSNQVMTLIYRNSCTSVIFYFCHSQTTKTQADIWCLQEQHKQCLVLTISFIPGIPWQLVRVPPPPSGSHVTRKYLVPLL